MLFNSVEFVIFFIVVATAIVIIKHRKFQHFFLLGSGYFFFYISSNYLISLLIFSTILDYFLGKEIYNAKTKTRKKILLILSLSGNLGLLGFFKYSDFAILQFNAFGSNFNLVNDIPLLNLALPIGISFYTFQTLSYTIDIYRGELEPSKKFREFALFVSFFPQLVAGPIVRAKHFLPQLRQKMDNNQGISKIKLIKIEKSNLKLGITMMLIGFLKKMFFADNIAPFVNEVFFNPINSTSYEIWLGTIAFGIQIYGDFSGYSDIAIGAALILGFKIPRNFNKPYFATSPSDFWKRWHISLSSWLKDYLYIPLGGNKISRFRTYQNLLIVMVLGGLWHGASINFIIWGGLHGVYLAIHKIIKNTCPQLTENSFFKTKIGKIFSILVTQYFVFLAWIPFRVHETDQMWYAMNKFVFFDFQLNGLLEFLMVHKFVMLIIMMFGVLHFISYIKPDIIFRLSNLRLYNWTIFATIVIILVIFFYNGNSEDFIYFRF